MKNPYGIGMWLMRSRQLCYLASCTHAHKKGREGRREGTRTASQNKQWEKTTKAENRRGSTQQAGKTKERQGGRSGKGARRNPTLARGAIRHSKTQQRDNWSRTRLRTKGRAGREEGEERGGERRTGRRKEVSQAMHAASMSPPGGKRKSCNQKFTCYIHLEADFRGH